MKNNTVQVQLPRWIDTVIIPILNLIVTFIILSMIVLCIGENPISVIEIMLKGAFGSSVAWGYTLYYTTNFIFTGLSFAIAFQCGLFNIGAEGQAYIGGLGVTLVALYLNGLPFSLIFILCIIVSSIFGAAWAYIPAYLQANRGSHIVVTTIMFNFIASSIMSYVIVHMFSIEHSVITESQKILDNISLPFIHEIFIKIGINMEYSPLNISFFYAVIILLIVWFVLWHTKWGLTFRTIGQSNSSIKYKRYIIISMMMSGALASFVALNEILGVHHRLMIDFTSGYGFVGIAVAILGKNHPLGIFFSALLFGMLYQSGTELSLHIATISSDMVMVLQGTIILLIGSMEYMLRLYMKNLLRDWRVLENLVNKR